MLKLLHILNKIYYVLLTNNDKKELHKTIKTHTQNITYNKL